MSKFASVLLGLIIVSTVTVSFGQVEADREADRAIEWGAFDAATPRAVGTTILAEQGDPAAQLDLYQIFHSSNPDLARHWLLKSAEQGFSAAQGTLGFECLHYNQGPLFSHNTAKGEYWLREAAIRGYALAQLQMAADYQKGIRVLQDYVQA